MASVTVYGPALSTAVSRVVACLLEKEVDFQLLPVDMSKGQHKSPDFLKLQPFGQVPAFRDEKTTLFESRAICRYICDKYADNGNKVLMGRREGGILEKAWVEQWLEAESQNFNPPCSALVFQLAFAPRMGLKQDPASIEQNEGKLAKVLDVYEQRLGESRFLAGDEFSLADLSHLPNSHYLVNATDKGGLITSRKNVGRWWEEISSRESWKKVVEMQKANAPPS
ncbi:glutathione S-transferase F11-like [Iris pallida]|uniref:glutathione transferase n=1 Tax=Iris pallida TaxID=29817 RepID=A0AAX6GLN3_IRIPA|nr:glutathione S-transferase F11-like [Iris pallida]KAJ6829699.1 glutathione S-transferase F11-like [Iris pallida]